MRYRYSQTDPIKGLGGVFGAHPLIALSVLFVLVTFEALHPGKLLVATSLPYPHKVNLLADTETTRRSCSSVGIPPLEIAAPVWLARDSEVTLRVKRLPCEASRTADCADVLVPAPGVTMNIMMKIDRVYWHRHSLLWPARIRGLYLKAAVQVRDAITYTSRTPAM